MVGREDGDRRFTGFAWGVLAYTLGVILWGAYVRATGSGAGCGRHWPLCNGEVVPRTPSLETLVELTHRLTSGLSLLLVCGLAWWAARRFTAGDRVRRAAFASLALMVLEGALGAGLVLFELVAENDSLVRAAFMAAHLVNTLLLVAALVLTAVWSAEPEAGGLGGVGRLFWLAVGAFALAGTSGAVAALGDTLFPGESLAASLASDLSTSSHILVQLRVLHPAFALVAAALLVGYTLERLEEAPEARVLGALVAVQVLGGFVNVVLLAPVWMQLVHLLVADLVWIQLLRVAVAVPARS